MRKIDLTGQRFGKLTVVSRAENIGQSAAWKCVCDCGNTKNIRQYSLTSGNTKSCGCAKRELISKAFKEKAEDLSGIRFGRLTVVSKSENIGNAVAWNCVCDCGNTVVVRAYSLKNGDTKSCGCLHKEVISEKLKIHGRDRLYRIWKNMINRCSYEKYHEYHLYGGRGISVCKEWTESHISFRNWAMANGYRDGLTLDRIDVNGNYEPSNCRWVTMKVQSNNRRNNVLITYCGKTLTATEWSRETGIKVETLIWRKKKGWSDKDCIEKPVQKRTKTKY